MRHGWTLLLLLATQVASAQAPPRGVVLAGDEPTLREALGAAREAGTARWDGEVVSAPEPTPAPELTALLDAYFDGEYVRCLEVTGRAELETNRLLADGHRHAAGMVVAARAACLERLHESERSRAALRQLLVQDLVSAEVEDLLRGDLHQLLEALRGELESEARVRVSVTSEPSGARVTVDAGSVSCDATPCRFLLRAGPHHFRVERDGYRHASQTRALGPEDGALAFSLGRPSMAESRVTLAATLSTRPEVTPDLLRDVANAWGRRLVLSTWRHDASVAAALYDRERDAVVTGTEPIGPRAVELAVNQAIREWTHAGEAPIWPWILGGAAALVAAAVVIGIVVGLQSEPEPQWVLRFSE